jgi:hypothetical protein
MENNIVSLIEKSINNKNEDTSLISKIKSEFNISIHESKLMIKYIKRFCIISSILDSQYMNYFNKTNLLDLREKDELKDEMFAKAIILFIKQKQANKKLYMVKLENENDIKVNILILSQLDYNSYEYDVTYNKQLNLKNNLNIFNYIKNLIDEYDFRDLSENLIENKIDSPLIPYLNLTNSNFQKILEYSQLYPNRIRYLDCYGFDPEKLQQILELNKNSLKAYPHGKFKFLAPLPKANIFNLMDLNIDGFIETNFDFSQIKKAVIETIELDQVNNYIYFLNKFNNLEELDFCSIDSETLFKITENIKCKKIKKISGVCEDLDDDCNYEKMFKNLPLLERFNIEEDQTMNWTYEISPIFLAERKRLPFPLLEQLIRNYLNGCNDRDIELHFDDEFDQFWEYFKTKKDIISKVSKLVGPGVFFNLDYYFKGIINKYNKINDIPKAKYKYFYIEESIDEQIFKFIQNINIEYLFIRKGGEIDKNQLIKCENLKFIFNNTTKSFLFRINGKLEDL